MPNGANPIWAEPGQIFFDLEAANPFVEAPPPPAGVRRRPLFGGALLKPKPPKVGDRFPALTDDFMNLLLNGVKEIFNKPAHVGGMALVDKYLDAKDAVFPVNVTLTIGDRIDEDFQKWDDFLKQVPELGWGDYRNVGAAGNGYLANLQFTVRNRPVILWLEEKTTPLEEYKTSLYKMRYTLDKGLETDPDFHKTLDKQTIYLYKKPDAKRLKHLNEDVLPRLKELTGKEFTLKEKVK